jgi:WD40 repeat protein
MHSCGRLPLISPWLYRREVRRTVRNAAAGDMAAVRELAAVFCSTPDSCARDLAGEGLRHLETPDQIALVCRECILRDNDDLRALVIGCGYLPADPAGRALWLFCISDISGLIRLGGGDYLTLLAAGYAAAEEVVRLRAREAARGDTACSILARSLAGTSVTQNAARWSYGEWEVVMAGISSDKRWDDLWLLAPLAPLPHATEAVRALKEAGWSPQGDDSLLWNNLTRELPDCWSCPVAPAQARVPVGRPAGQVSRVSFSPDGSLLATGCCDGTITVWRTTTAGFAAEFAGAGSVTFLAIPAGNTCIVSAGEDAALRCHSLEDRILLWSWMGRGEGASIALSSDGSSVQIGDSSGTLHVLDLRDGKVLASLPLHPSPVTCIAAAPSGGVTACGHADGTLSVIRFGNGSAPRILPGNGSPVLALSFSLSGTECLVVYERGHPSQWDIVAGRRMCTFTGHTGRAICCAAPADSGWFGIGSDDHMFRCWDLTRQSPGAIIPFYSRHITTCSVSPGGSLLAAGFQDGSVRIYHMPEANLLREFKGHKKTVTSCKLSPGENRLATVSWDGTTKLWHVPEGEIVRTFDTHAGGIASLAGPAGTLVAAVTEDGIARIIDAADGRTVRTLDLYTPGIRSAAMSPDGLYLVSTGTDSSVRCWNIRDGSLVAAADRQATSFWCSTFLPDTSIVVTGGWDGTCRLFGIPETVPLRTLFGHSSIVTCCTVSRDGSLLVTGSNDTTVRLWHLAEEEASVVLRNSRSEVRAVALSPDGTLLSAGNREGDIRLFRLPYGTIGPGLPGLPGTVTALVFSPDGCVLAVGYGAGTVAFFSVPERSLIRTLPAHSGAVTGLALLPDGRTLVSTGTDGLCRFHEMPRIPFLVHANVSEMPATVPGEELPHQGMQPDPAAFHRALLAARFRGEIGICLTADSAGCYDIQIVG